MVYLITIIVFLVVVFKIKIVFPIWRFYTLSENIVSTYEMLDAVLLEAERKKVENVESKPIVLKYGKYKVTYNNLQEAYETLRKQCEIVLCHAEKLDKLLFDYKQYEQDKWQVTNIYNSIRSELWKNKLN